jgi:hypothetical protein
LAAWNVYDAAQSQLGEMEKFSSQLANISPAQIPLELTSEKTPPAEIAVAHRNLRAELAKIAEAQNDIKAYQAEITRIESQRRTLIAIAVIVIIVFLCIAACGGLFVLNALLSSLSRYAR